VRVSRASNAERAAGLQTLLDVNDARKRVDKVLKSASRKHDGVPTPTNIFRDFQKPSAFVLFEIQKEDLPINLNFLGRERFIYLVWCVVINHKTAVPALFLKFNFSALPIIDLSNNYSVIIRSAIHSSGWWLVTGG
jgi:hypothetical protein